MTKFPEMMDGRVKTLHPMVHGGLLAKRDNAKHMAEAAEHGIQMIDMVVVNLYAFEKTVESGADFGTCIENIDIGGPSMLRSAAKNFEASPWSPTPKPMRASLPRCAPTAAPPRVRPAWSWPSRCSRPPTPTTAPSPTSCSTRFRPRIRMSTARVAAAVAREGIEAQGEFPPECALYMQKQQDLRYGENPHQQAVFYRVDEFAHEHSLVNAQQLNGKELSYNNILDTDACWSLVRELDEPAVIILKHQNPCGSATAETITEAYDKAFACDPKSAFGGIIAANRQVTLEMVEHINENKQFVEVLIAPEFESAALELLQQKKNLRVLRTGGIDAPAAVEVRSVDGGVLVQDVDHVSEDPATFTVPTDRKPTDAEMHELMFAWRVCKGVKSNAILVSRNHAGIGMGPGQPNRVDSALLACKRAHEACELHGRGAQGPGVRVRRVLPVPRQRGHAGRVGHHCHHPARRLRARRGVHPGVQRARHRHGVHRPSPLPPLIGVAGGRVGCVPLDAPAWCVRAGGCASLRLCARDALASESPASCASAAPVRA